jgi:glucose-6-phosphate isomerase
MSTEYALYKAKRMNRTIMLPEVNAFTIGQLLYMLEVETAFVAELLNINAFDQPGVEEGKIATYALMGRPGYERKKAELDSRPEKKAEYII